MKTPQRAGLGAGPFRTLITPEYPTATTSPNSLITAKPELRKRNGTPLNANDPRFIGWQTTGKEVVQRACDSGYTYSESGNYWNCCPTTGDCSFATNCIAYGTSQFEVFPNGDTSLCGYSTYCYFDWVYSVTDDPSPKAFVGCATDGYHALRTANSQAAEAWTYVTPPLPSTIDFPPEVHPTATSDQLALADHSIQLGGGFSASWSVKLTPLTGAILAAAVIFLILLCCLARWKQSRNARRKRNPVPLRPYFGGPPGPPPPNLNYSNDPPPYDPVVFPQQHELTPIPIHNMYDPRPQALGGGILGGQSQSYARLPGEEVADGFSPNAGQMTGIIEGPGATSGGINR